MPNSLELNVSPALLHTFANHPFHVRKDMEMNELVDSIRESGVIVPLIVRSRPEGGYEIISGHRRCEACRELGIEKVPVRVQELTDDEATILMVNSNIQREHVLPSEKAFAYKMKLDAMKNQGTRSDLTSTQVVSKLRSNEKLGAENNQSRETVRRFIRLTNLTPELLDMPGAAALQILRMATGQRHVGNRVQLAKQQIQMLHRRADVAIAHADPRLQGDPVPVKTELSQGALN